MLRNGNHSLVINCLLDTGSQRSYVSSDVLSKLNFSNEKRSNFQITTFFDVGNKTFTDASLSIDFMDNRKSFVLPFLVSDSCRLTYTIDGLCDAHSNIAQKFTLAHHATSNVVELDGLLGVDSLQFLKKMNIVPCLGGVALELSTCVIPFGNVDNFLTEDQLLNKYSRDSGTASAGLLEQSDDLPIDKSIINFVLNPSKISFDPIAPVMRESLVEDRLDKMFSLDSLGIQDDESDYDKAQIDQFNANITLDNGTYFVKLPFTDKIKDVKSNYGVCKAILNKVVTNLKKDKLFDSYNEIFEQQLNDGIIEKISVPADELSSLTFIPHRPVIRDEENVTTKIRIVLNCSLKTDQNPSLNEASYPGVNLMNSLLALLIKIRHGQYIAMGDIRKAFLMIRLKEEQDANRFCLLWVDSNNHIIIYRYRTIVFGYVSSPFILGQVIKMHLKRYPVDECTEVLSNNLYVDNLFVTGDSPAELQVVCDTACDRMAEGGFELRAWVSNSADLADQFEQDGRAATPCSSHKLLGYTYSPATDKLSVTPFETNTAGREVTKRSVLSYVSRVFDPTGVTNPITVRSKELLRNIWNDKYEWDDPVSDSLNNEWSKLKSDLDQLPNFTFERHAYGDNIKLYLLCDSSKTGYGFACYAGSEIKKVWHNNLIFSKVKIAPLKGKTLPTLELMAAYLALKCLPTIIDAINKPILEITLAIDAQIVLTWILSQTVKTKNICARNRVKDITVMRQDIKDKYGLECKFRYIPTELNAADLITRGLSYKELCEKSKFWLHGPAFLNACDVVWPVSDMGCLSPASRLLACSTVAQPIEPAPAVMPSDSYSDVNKLFRVTALLFKFIALLKKDQPSMDGCLNKAKSYWIKLEQKRCYPAEIDFLTNGNANVPVLVKNLNLFIDQEGMMRSKGRLDNCDLFPEHVNNPILLPKESFVTKLLISDAHATCKHLGTPTTLGQLRRSGFWIPQGRTAVKAVLRQCIPCKKINSSPFKYPKPNNFMTDRVTLVKPFNHVGIDFTGNFLVKFGDKYTKMYILVFTCINTRAIHLELLPNMTCQQFVLAYIRFTNHHTIASTVYSDNQSTFLQGMGILSNSHSSDDFSLYLQRTGIRHLKIPLYSAWCGTFWERCIRTIKSAIYKSVGRKRLEYFQFISLLSDITNAINNRPLTYRENDINFEPLCPNSFLKLDHAKDFFVDNVAGSELQLPNRKDLVRALDRRDELFSNFKEAWYADYLLSLREASRDLYQDKWEEKVKEGDIVLVEAPNKSRPWWNLGRVAELLPGKDGKTRTVRIARPDRSEGVHSLRHLYPLELCVTPRVLHSQQVVENDATPPGPITRAATRRALSTPSNGN